MKSDTSHSHSASGTSPQNTEQGEVDEIIYRLSHDLRGSTRALSELPVWIQEDMQNAGLEIPGTVQECLTLLQDHAQRLNKMIDGLLIHSRVGRDPAIEVDAAQAVEKALSRIDIPNRANLRHRLKNATVSISMPDMELALTVLIGNALTHASPRTHIAITGSIEPAAPATDPKVYWVLKVRDEGPGIPERHRETVFKPMVALHAASEQKGVGMGLAILDKIAQHNGGHAWVATPTRKRQGATVCLALPIVEYPS